MKQIAVALSCLFVLAAQATDWHWKGAEGEYSLTSNTWEADDGTRGVAKGSDAIAVFDGDATLVWANTSGTQPIGGIKVLAGTVTFNSTYNITRPINFANITNDIYVAPGATLILNGHSPCGTNGAAAATQVVRLTGGGTLRTCGGSQLGRVNNDNLLCRFVVCADSTLEISGTADGVRLDDALVVEAGGVAKMLGNNLIQNSTVIHVEKGGEFRADGFSDTLGALTGDGLVVIGAANLTLPAEKGPFAFGGLMKADIALGATTTEENQYCLVTTARAFENCSFATAAVAGGPSFASPRVSASFG